MWGEGKGVGAMGVGNNVWRSSGGGGRGRGLEQWGWGIMCGGAVGVGGGGGWEQWGGGGVASGDGYVVRFGCVALAGDNWVLECGQENWSRDEAVRFRHYHTNA